MSEICRVLDWDSQFFGMRIARLEADAVPEPLLADATAWCVKERIDCLYYLASGADAAAAPVLEDAGFRLTDIRITLSLKVPTGAGAASASLSPLRQAVAADEDALARIARGSHHDSRFYADPRFPPQRCDDLYDTWIRKSCAGWAKAVVTSGPEGQPDGYCSCHVDAANATGSIGLVAVAEHARGKGVGKALIAGALRFFAGSGVQRVTVVTQGRNVPAQRLYQNAGFQTDSVQLWFHKWFKPQTSGVASHEH